jgi:hypothetical protein
LVTVETLVVYTVLVVRTTEEVAAMVVVGTKEELPQDRVEPGTMTFSIGEGTSSSLEVSLSTGGLGTTMAVELVAVDSEELPRPASLALLEAAALDEEEAWAAVEEAWEEEEA